MHTALAGQSVSVSSAPAQARAVNGARSLLRAEEEASLLKVNLDDLVLPEVNNLQVDGLEKSWFARLFGK